MASNNKNLSTLLNPLSKDNPVIVQILGICSCLAVTAKLEPAFVMGISVIAVLAFSNVIISLLRNTIPTNIRIIVQLVVVAGLVVIVNQLLMAYQYDVSKQLSVFIGLIVTNCILMGRLEAFAMATSPGLRFSTALATVSATLSSSSSWRFSANFSEAAPFGDSRWCPTAGMPTVMPTTD